MDLHNSEVDRVSRRQPSMTQDDLLGTVHYRLIDPKYFVDDSQQGIERWLNGIRTLDRNVTVKDFLQHFRIGYQPLAATH